MSTRRFHVSLRLRVAATGVVGLLGLFFVGGSYLLAAKWQEERQRVADDAIGIARLSNDVQEAMLKARDAEKDFMLNSDEGVLAGHEQAVKEAQARLAMLADRLAAIGETDLVNKAQAARRAVERYSKQFATVVGARRTIGLTGDSGLEGAIRNTIRAIEAELEKFDDPRLAAGIHPVRRFEREHMLRRDGLSLFGFKKAFGTFSDAINAASLPAQAKSAFLAKLEAYKRDFDAWVRAAEQVADASALTTAELTNIAPAIDQIERNVSTLFSNAVAANAASREATRLQILVAMGLAIVAVAALALLIGLSISRPLSAMTAAMRRLAEGELDLTLPGLGRKDEIGQMAKAVEAFKTLAREKARAEAQERENGARVAAVERKAEMTKLADAFEAAVGEVVTAVSASAAQLQGAAGRLTTTADTTRQLSSVVASASTEASANVQTVAASAEELASSVAEIARQVDDSARMANRAVEQAEAADRRVNELSTLASRVGDVVKFITAIAEQTNLLALNATIEAARAGQAGRGFAVVAQEVKALAAQTAQATGDISAQISGMQLATRDSADAIKEIGRTIQNMAEIAAGIATAVEEQGAATAEIARNVQTAAKGTAEVACNIGDVSRGAGETGAATSEVLSAAVSLSGQSDHLRAELDKFLATVRAA